jgi:hypothetical protein
MKLNSVAAIAIAAFSAFLAPAGGQSAFAGEILDRLRSHGLGKWVDKYVEEDKSGAVRYKRAKQDTWSQDYYDSTTGKWTGKKHNGEQTTGDAKTTSKKKPLSLSSRKSSTSFRTAVASHSSKKKKIKDTASESLSAAPAAAAEPIKTEPPAVENKSPETPATPLSKPTAQGTLVPTTALASVGETNGPQAPDDLGPAVY